MSTVAAPAYGLERLPGPAQGGTGAGRAWCWPSSVEEELGAQGGGGGRKRQGRDGERELLRGELRALQKAPPGLSAEYQ